MSEVPCYSWGMLKIIPSPHAVQRAKTRAGWCRRTLERMLERIYYFGLTPERCGRQLRDYLASIDANDVARFARVYGEHIFIFGHEAGADQVALVTVLHLPADLRSLAHRARSRSFSGPN